MNCGSGLVRLSVWFGVQQELCRRLWEGTHVFVKFVLAFQHLISDCITWRRPALLPCLHLIYRWVLWTELVLRMRLLPLQRVGLNPVYTIQPVVTPVVNAVWLAFDNRVEQTATVRSAVRTPTVRSTGLYTRYSRLSNRLSNGFDNRLNVCIHHTTFGQPAWQPVWQPVVSCIQTSNRLLNRWQPV